MKKPRKKVADKVEPAEDVIKTKQVFSLRLSKQELLHLRDLFGVLLPADMKATISQSLAASQGRHLIESKLWNKLSSLCEEANIPCGDEAPDFIVTMSAPPQLGVFEMMPEILEQEEDIPGGLQSILQGEDK